MKPGRMRRVESVFVLLFFLIGMFFVQSFNGDWIVNAENITSESNIIQKEKDDITIQSGGKLTIENSILKMDPEGEQNKIRVESGGEIVIIDSDSSLPIGTFKGSNQENDDSDNEGGNIDTYYSGIGLSILIIFAIVWAYFLITKRFVYFEHKFNSDPDVKNSNKGGKTLRKRI